MRRVADPLAGRKLAQGHQKTTPKRHVKVSAAASCSSSLPNVATWLLHDLADASQENTPLRDA